VYPSPFTDRSGIWHTGAQRKSTLIYQISPGSLYSDGHKGEKTPYFTAFSTLASCIGVPKRRRNNVEHGCTTANVVRFSDVKKLLISSNAFWAKSFSHTLRHKSVTDSQTNIELNIFGFPDGVLIKFEPHHMAW